MFMCQNNYLQIIECVFIALYVYFMHGYSQRTLIVFVGVVVPMIMLIMECHNSQKSSQSPLISIDSAQDINSKQQTIPV